MSTGRKRRLGDVMASEDQFAKGFTEDIKENVESGIIDQEDVPIKRTRRSLRSASTTLPSSPTTPSNTSNSQKKKQKISSPLPASPSKRDHTSARPTLGASPVPLSKTALSSAATPIRKRPSHSTSAPLSVQKSDADLTQLQSPSTPNQSGKIHPIGTPKTPSMVYKEAKALFRRCSVPMRLIGREPERSAIASFVERTVLVGQHGALYISGMPGTGKTALVNEVLASKIPKEGCGKIKMGTLNCMSLITSPAQLYGKLYQLLTGKKVPTKDAVSELKQLLTKSSSKVMYLVVLDEMDSLLSKDQDVLYSLFEWSILTKSNFCLIGIANALDLTDRFLPRLRIKHCEPELLHFNPYNVGQIKEIIEQRLSTLGEGLDEGLASFGSPSAPRLMQPMAVELCARKIADTGDLRKALDICRKAIELVETEVGAHPSPGPLAKGKSVPVDIHSPITHLSQVPNITVKHVLNATSSVFGTTFVSKVKECSTQAKMVLCVLAAMVKEKVKNFTVSRLHDNYVHVCRTEKQMAPCSRSEFADLLSMLESASLITMKGGAGKSAEKSLHSVTLTIQPGEVEDGVANSQLLTGLVTRAASMIKPS